MDVVALISGGKDSCFSMMCAVKEGHRIVALANLLPVEESRDDVDSWMFQTVGHNVIGAYSSVMGGIPLFRRKLRGTAISTGMGYSGIHKGDEVEDLFALLHTVILRYPNVKAVCSGAILSNYQRARVESVCARLGLVSLAFLWQRDQRALLDSMIESGLNAVLVKTASLGLEISHLGKSLAQLRPMLINLEKQFGVSVCGEGGEYESLTLDCPLFSHRIVLEKVSTHSMGSGATLLHVHDFLLESKSGNASEEAASACIIDCPDMLPTEPLHQESPQGAGTVMSLVETTPANSRFSSLRIEVSRGAYHLLASQLFGASRGRATVFVLVHCDDISQFGAFNTAYGPLVANLDFPPARAVWQPIAMQNLCAEAIFFDKAPTQEEMKWLHVQSISAWAPACIGPYSQLVQSDSVIWMSGMIPLDPLSMTLSHAGEPLLDQLELCLRHCSAVLRSMGWTNCRENVVRATLMLVAQHESAHELLQGALQTAVPHAIVCVVLCDALPRGAPLELLCVASPTAATAEWKRTADGQAIEGRHIGFAVGSPASMSQFVERIILRQALDANTVEVIFATGTTTLDASAQSSSSDEL